MNQRQKRNQEPGINQKLVQLKQSLAVRGRLAVAFSGGVDSAFLLKTAYDVLGSGVLAVTIKSRIFPKREEDEAGQFCARYGIRQTVCQVDELEVSGFAQNPENRCYLCKQQMMQVITQAAKEEGIFCVAEGSNADDANDYRPGQLAVAEAGVFSPLREAGLTKAEIRILSRQAGLPTWDKQSFACLASRFVYGEQITPEKLTMIDRAEQLLLELGFHQVRVRMHGTMARIEILPQQFGRLLEDRVRSCLTEKLREYGFSYVTMDLEGYRTGSMNEGIRLAGPDSGK